MAVRRRRAGARGHRAGTGAGRGALRARAVGPRRVRRGAAWCGVLAALALGVAGCRPLYLPPVPPVQPAPSPARLGDGSALRVVGDTLVLHVVLAQIPHEGWLAVQWFAPDDTEAASDSVWVAPSDAGQGRTVRLPSRVRLTPGEWRAVTSLGGSVLRQFRVDVPPSAGASPP